MDLDATVKFSEAKESGKKAGVYLDNREAALNKMTGYRHAQRDILVEERVKPEETGDDVRCRYCGINGHNATPDFKTKRE